MKDNMDCEIISWETFYNLCRKLTFLIREKAFQPDMIVAVGRGGYLPARILSDHFGLTNLADFKIEHYRDTRKDNQATIRYPLPDGIRAKRVLLVDDVSDSGDTLAVARSHVEEKIAPEIMKTAVLHYKTVSACRPDYFAAKVEKWRWIIYPWALIEDLTSFITRMQPVPGNEEEIMERLRTDYGLNIPATTAGDILEYVNDCSAGR